MIVQHVLISMIVVIGKRIPLALYNGLAAVDTVGVEQYHRPRFAFHVENLALVVADVFKYFKKCTKFSALRKAA
jgi:hypothetical protein